MGADFVLDEIQEISELACPQLDRSSATNREAIPLPPDLHCSGIHDHPIDDHMPKYC
jgi:hypothetical protein